MRPRSPNGGGLILIRIGLPAMSHRSRYGGGLILVRIGLPATCRCGDGGIHDVSTWESRTSRWAGWGTRPMCPNNDILIDILGVYDMILFVLFLLLWFWFGLVCLSLSSLSFLLCSFRILWHTKHTHTQNVLSYSLWFGFLGRIIVQPINCVTRTLNTHTQNVLSYSFFFFFSFSFSLSFFFFFFSLSLSLSFVLFL